VVKPTPKKSSGYDPLDCGVTLTAGFGLLLEVVPITILGFGVAKVASLSSDQFVTLPIEKLTVAELSSCVKVWLDWDQKGEPMPIPRVPTTLGV